MWKIVHFYIWGLAGSRKKYEVSLGTLNWDFVMYWYGAVWKKVMWVAFSIIWSLWWLNPSCVAFKSFPAWYGFPFSVYELKYSWGSRFWIKYGFMHYCGFWLKSSLSVYNHHHLWNCIMWMMWALPNLGKLVLLFIALPLWFRFFISREMLNLDKI
jgi:hypothetical protein